MTDQTQGLAGEPSVSTVQPAHLSLNGAGIIRGDGESIDALRRDALGHIQGIAPSHGQRALENPRSAAIVHEAGHAVMYAHFGEAVRYVKIRKRKRGVFAGQWLGVAMGGSKWRSDSKTSPESDFRQACYQMAGVIAEIVFDTSNFRLTSSTDEVIRARLLASNIAVKTAADAENVMMQVISVTRKILKDNAGIVREIATLLDRHKVVRKKRLAPILAWVTSCPAEFRRAA
jgi:hypothetical protein